MNSLTVVMAYYDNPMMLARQYAQFRALSDEVKQRLELVVVDDGSPKVPAFYVPHPLDLPELQVFRILKDIRWNQDGARNVGVHHATKPWVLLTDIDHLIPESTLLGVMNEHLTSGRVYKFSRVEFDGKTPYKVHPNSWLMEKKIYDSIGGYDERFAGYYGTDWDFRDRVLRVSSVVQQLPYPLIRVGRENISDASCPREFGRKNPDDAHAIQRIKREREKNKGWKPLRLVQPYERVF